VGHIFRSGEKLPNEDEVGTGKYEVISESA